MLWLPCALAVWLGSESCSCACYGLVFPRHELWCSSEPGCPCARWQGHGGASPTWTATGSVLQPCARDTSAPRQRAGDHYLSPWPGRGVGVREQGDPTHQHRGGISGCESPRAPHADAAFPPLQYYEMSYGLNIEMHKQVSVSGMGACSSSLSLPLRGRPHGMHGKHLPAVAHEVCLGVVLLSLDAGSSAPLRVVALARLSSLQMRALCCELPFARWLSGACSQLGCDKLVAAGREQRWSTSACTTVNVGCARPLGDRHGGDGLPQSEELCRVTAG